MASDTISESPKKSDITRNMILDRSLELFRERGFEETTMRAIAEACSLTPGAAYYHFSSKEELVLEWYRCTAEEAREHAVGVVKETKDFTGRFRAILDFKHRQLSPYRNLVSVLARQAGATNSALSPFSDKTKPIRDDAMGLIELAVEGSELRVSSVLRPRLAQILWLYQMGIIFYWANDASEKQSRTGRLIDLSLEVVVRLLSFSSLPFMNVVNRRVISIVELVEACGERTEELTTDEHR